MSTATVDTVSTVSLTTPAGRALLRRIANRRGESWHMLADDRNGWRLRLFRCVPPARPGDSETTVTVETDSVVVGADGWGVVQCGDGDPVPVPEARFVNVHGAECRAAAGLMAGGWRLAIERSAGSPNSSKHGLAFLRLQAYRDGYTQSVTIGETVYVHGQRVIAGPVDA